MKSIFGKSFAAGAVLAASIGGTQAAGLVGTYNAQACTSDGHTAHARFAILADEKSPALVPGDMAQTLKDMLAKAVKPYTGEQFSTGNQDFVRDILQAMKDKSKETGFGIAGEPGDVTPGCKPQ